MRGNSRFRSIDRRSYLKGCLVGVGSTLAFGGVASADHLEREYSNVVDIVDAGADPTGETPITPVLREVVDDDTLIQFPEGRYAMDEQLRLTDFDNVGFVGHDATLVPANYYQFDGPQYRLFRLGTRTAPGRDLRFEGFEIDQTAANTGIRVINAEVEDGLLVRDVVVNGIHDAGTWGPGLFNIVDPDGEGHVDCFKAPDGGVHVDSTPNEGNMWKGPTGIHVNEYHDGTLIFENCELGGFPGNGLYGFTENGQIGIDGGHFENSGTASIRLSGSRGAIRNASITVDDNPDDASGQHAIRIDDGETFHIENVTIDAPEPNGEAIRVMSDVEDVTIEDTDVSVGEGGSSAIRLDSGSGTATFSDVDVDIDGSAYAFRILGDDPGAVTLKDVSVTGDASGIPIRHAILCERDDVTFQGLTLEQTGSDERGGLYLSGDDYRIADSNLETANTAIAITGASDVTIEDTVARSSESNSVHIYADSGSVSLEDNSFPDGVRDDR
ncbi:right-handed parallel beta-helix repeat-containing protein [Halostagnicola kamekurae]|uniref:Right handed beta helix region n=1 Tax=Halostagnicola kamekurae TaxID=619731 RepID=A0A1I6QLS9_9EURY|nr:right-handed parallel beta-helix repeat-containing protein [Halostagnicola kamekurae]SFS53437.1 hypothetical protein SAMN04488556_1363 [Halostagnicola kamekurae]